MPSKFLKKMIKNFERRRQKNPKSMEKNIKIVEKKEEKERSSQKIKRNFNKLN